MNRRNFLLTIPAVALGAELLVPKRTIFLPPRGGWIQHEPEVWAVKMEGSYFFSNHLNDLVENRAFDKYPIVLVRDRTHVADQRGFMTPVNENGYRQGCNYAKRYNIVSYHAWEKDLCRRL